MNDVKDIHAFLAMQKSKIASEKFEVMRAAQAKDLCQRMSKLTAAVSELTQWSELLSMGPWTTEEHDLFNEVLQNKVMQDSTGEERPRPQQVCKDFAVFLSKGDLMVLGSPEAGLLEKVDILVCRCVSWFSTFQQWW